jgi:hypothetical protein
MSEETPEVVPMSAADTERKRRDRKTLPTVTMTIEDDDQFNADRLRLGMNRQEYQAFLVALGQRVTAEEAMETPEQRAQRLIQGVAVRAGK